MMTTMVLNPFHSKLAAAVVIWFILLAILSGTWVLTGMPVPWRATGKHRAPDSVPDNDDDNNDDPDYHTGDSDADDDAWVYELHQANQERLMSPAGFIRGISQLMEGTTSTSLPVPDDEDYGYSELPDAPFNLIRESRIMDMPVTGPLWVDVHWAWYGQEWLAESYDYHDKVEWERRQWRREMGLAA